MANERARQDVLLAAYAMSLGFQVIADGFTEKGLPAGTLAFHKNEVRVWFTARGWRVAREVGGRIEGKPADSDFFVQLKKALDAAHAQSL